MKFVIEIVDITVDAEPVDLDYVREAIEMGCDAYGITFQDITHYDSYEELT